MNTSLLVTFQPGFEALAERDVRAADPRAKSVATLEPGLWQVRPAADDPEARRLTANLRQSIAIRHLHPVSIEADVADLAELVALVEPLASSLSATSSYAVQTRLVISLLPDKAIAINDAVAEALAPAGIPYDRRNPDQVVSITIAGKRAYAGAGKTRDNLSAFPGGARRYARSEGSPSRAEHKLLEALEVFELTPRGHAIDLGAAPGGWTRVLAERGVAVTAIDPAELEPSVTSMPGVTVYRGTAERYLATRARPVDLIVSDMRMDARDAARLLLAFRPMLAPGGRLLTTLKLPEKSYLTVLDKAFELLDEGFRRVAARQLYHNRSEVTVLLQPSDAGRSSR